MVLMQQFSLLLASFLGVLLVDPVFLLNKKNDAKPPANTSLGTSNLNKYNVKTYYSQGGKINVAVKSDNKINVRSVPNQAKQDISKNILNQTDIIKSETSKPQDGIKNINGTTNKLPAPSKINNTTNATNSIIKAKNITTSPAPQKAKQNMPNKVDNKIANKDQKELQEKNYHRGSVKLNFDSICTCDLQRYVCDINCCCDADCRESDKRIFKFCELDKNRYYDDRFCDYARHIYINNTPYQWMVNQEGMFCVIKTNQPKSYVLQKKQPLKSFKSAEVEKNGANFWIRNDNKIDNVNQTIIFGDSVWILDKNDNQKRLALPKSYLSIGCIYEEDILYLQNTRRSCSQFKINQENSYLDFASYILDKKVVSQPQYLNNISKASNYNGSLYQACPMSLCLPIDAYICENSFLNCKVFNSNITRFNCSFDVLKNLMTCLNALEKIHYTFIHNGTIGLLKVEVKAVLRNFSFSFIQNVYEFEQEFSVDFKWIYQKGKNASEVLSGSPGYIMGKPILIATQIIIGNDSVIERNSSKFLDNFLTIPNNKQGKCVLNETEYLPIEFGYNSISRCEFKQEIIVIKNTTFINANKSCQIVQKRLMESLKIPVEVNKTVLVGLFGNSHPFDKKAWNEILFQTSPLRFVNETYGNFSNQNKTLKCFQILTSISIDVLYSRVDLEDLRNQNKILAMEYKFENLKNFTFDIKKNNSVDLGFILKTKVEFFDVTTEKKKKFVQAPSLKISLPYDFFYPFIKVDNSSQNFRSSVFGIISLCLFLWWF